MNPSLSTRLVSLALATRWMAGCAAMTAIPLGLLIYVFYGALWLLLKYAWR
jgi:hypothetical protein